MKVVFIGSKGMGCLALEELVRQQANILAVVARWDDPNPNQWYPSVTKKAQDYGFEVYTPKDINAPEFVAQIRELAPDLLLTAFYPKIYKQPLLELAPSGSLNLHFAPLPRYRGSFPGAWAIINGESSHGVTLHYMTPGVDSGDIIAQREVPITPDDTGLSLYHKCESAGLGLLRDIWPTIQAGTIQTTTQDSQAVIYYDRTYPYGGVINFNWSAQQIYDYVRAMTFPPFPNPFTFFRGRKLTILKTEITNHDSRGEIGAVMRLDQGIAIQAQCGIITVLECVDNRGQGRSLSDIIDHYGLHIGAVLGR